MEEKTGQNLNFIRISTKIISELLNKFDSCLALLSYNYGGLTGVRGGITSVNTHVFNLNISAGYSMKSTETCDKQKPKEAKINQRYENKYE
jgi:hypothetical protein